MGARPSRAMSASLFAHMHRSLLLARCRQIFLKTQSEVPLAPGSPLSEYTTLPSALKLVQITKSGTSRAALEPVSLCNSFLSSLLFATASSSRA